MTYLAYNNYRYELLCDLFQESGLREAVLYGYLRAGNIKNANIMYDMIGKVSNIDCALEIFEYHCLVWSMMGSSIDAFKLAYSKLRLMSKIKLCQIIRDAIGISGKLSDNINLFTNPKKSHLMRDFKH